ncbi:MAG: membrane protein insertase YidC [Candidatus Omnitrophica bacterium]|nr:membrane protein insertase YidC [Candidatus Omnitrophota bacterium]
MEKRSLIAVALSIGVLVLWSVLFPQSHPIAKKEVIEKTEANSPVASGTIKALPVEKPIIAVTDTADDIKSLPTFTYSREGMDIVFIESRAAIKEIDFKNHENYKFNLGEGFLSSGSKENFKLYSKDANKVVFVFSDGIKKIFKEFIFSNTNNSIELVINVQNVSSNKIELENSVILGRLDISPVGHQQSFLGTVLSSEEKTLHIGLNKEVTLNNATFVGLKEKYFCAIIENKTEKSTGFVRRFNGKVFDVGLTGNVLSVLPGKQVSQNFQIYLGPLDLRIINQTKPSWATIIHYGTFDFIAQILLQALEFFHKLVHNWGLAIILLSLAVYLLLYPLSIKQMKSMKEMQILQPKIEALRKTYKDDAQKLNKEIMELYKEHKVNPFGGCLPLLLQMPIFFALYQVLLRSFALKGSSFLWIKDLSEPDRLYTLQNAIPLMGKDINILPVIMAIGMFVQQKLTMAKSGGEAAEQQKIMLIVMPIMFGVIFYNMPAGLVLYWFVNSILMLISQLRMNATK